jgi:membrane protease subunit (stomatin/prohibitin family)
MQRLVGTNFTFTVNDVQECFNKEVQETTGALIARFFREENVNVNELGSEYKRVASLIGTQLAKVFSSYGLELTNFNVAKMGFDENDENYKKVMDSIAERARLSQLGVTYTQQKQFDIAEAMANNKGAGTMMGVGMGIGLGQQMGQIMGQMMGNVMSPQTSASASSFYVAVNGQSKGPYTLDVIRGMIGRGEVLPTTYVFKMGGLDWIYAQEEPELAANFRSMTPPPPPAY